QVEVGVYSGEKVDKVELFVNGKLMGTVQKPPYRFNLDVGDDNIRREFRAVVHTTTGAAAADTVVTVPVQINDEMNLKLRALFASVVRDGKSNLGLEQGDFELFENGAPQQIVPCGRDDLPLTAVLLLDTSESMGGERLDAVRRGTRAFLDGMKPSDEA